MVMTPARERPSSPLPLKKSLQPVQPVVRPRAGAAEHPAMRGVPPDLTCGPTCGISQRSPVGLPSGRRRACPPPVGGPAALLAPSCPGRCPSCAAASGRRLREGAGAGRLRAVAVLAAVDLRDPASAACSCAPATHVAFVAGRLRQRARVRPPPGGGRGPWTGTPLVVRARSGCSRSPRSPRCAPEAPANRRAQRAGTADSRVRLVLPPHPARVRTGMSLALAWCARSSSRLRAVMSCAGRMCGRWQGCAGHLLHAEGHEQHLDVDLRHLLAHRGRRTSPGSPSRRASTPPLAARAAQAPAAHRASRRRGAALPTFSFFFSQ